jgi:hypothetical protein
MLWLRTPKKLMLTLVIHKLITVNYYHFSFDAVRGAGPKEALGARLRPFYATASCPRRYSGISAIAAVAESLFGAGPAGDTGLAVDVFFQAVCNNAFAV